MELDYSDIVAAIKDGIRESRDEDPPPRAITAIKPFEAVDSAGRKVEVIGVVWHDDMLQFVVIVRDPDDESIYPISLETVYPPGTPPAELPPLEISSGRKSIRWPEWSVHPAATGAAS